MPERDLPPRRGKMDLEAEIFGAEAEQDDLPEEFKTMSAEDIQRR